MFELALIVAAPRESLDSLGAAGQYAMHTMLALELHRRPYGTLDLGRSLMIVLSSVFFILVCLSLASM